MLLPLDGLLWLVGSVRERHYKQKRILNPDVDRNALRSVEGVPVESLLVLRMINAMPLELAIK